MDVTAVYHSVLALRLLIAAGAQAATPWLLRDAWRDRRAIHRAGIFGPPRDALDSAFVTEVRRALEQLMLAASTVLIFFVVPHPEWRNFVGSGFQIVAQLSIGANSWQARDLRRRIVAAVDAREYEVP